VICEILTFNCTKMCLATGLCPNPLGELIALPQIPLLDFRGRDRERRGREERRGKGRGGKEGKERGKEGEGQDRPNRKGGYGPV